MLVCNVYSKTTFVIDYMIVKLMTMRPVFYFNYYIIQYHSKHGKGDVIYYECILY